MSDQPGTSAGRRSWPRRLLNRWEVDQAVFFAIAARGWQIPAGMVTLALIVTFFTPVEQGYYYTFWSLIALQMFFDLSLHQVLINFASHEWEKLSLDADGFVQGDGAALSRLRSLVRSAVTWYGTAAGLFLVIVGTAGFLFFSYKGTSVVEWRAPWTALVALNAVTFLTIPALAVLEGCNEVRSVYRLQLIRTVTGNLVVWFCIPLGTALWTPAIVSLTRLACEFLVIGITYRRFFASVLHRPANEIIPWKTEVWPFQWRVGLRGLSAFVNTYLMNLVVFHYHSEAAAGRIGMTLNVLTSLEAACASWVKARTARLGMLVARRDFVELNRIFRRLGRIAFAVLAVSCLLFSLGTLAVFHVGTGADAWPEWLRLPAARLADRMAQPWSTAILSLGLTLVLIPDIQWTYVHAHKRSPHLWFTIVGSILTGGLVWVSGRQYGVAGVAAAYTAVMVLYHVPVSTWIWRRCRSEWQGDPAPAGVDAASDRIGRGGL
jgi:hypothetical protein